MATLTDQNKEWLDYDGYTVRLSGVPCVLRSRAMEARYPYRHVSLSVSADPINKQSESYQATKRILGDDWSTDVLASDVEVSTDVLMQCRKIAPALDYEDGGKLRCGVCKGTCYQHYNDGTRNDLGECCKGKGRI